MIPAPSCRRSGRQAKGRRARAGRTILTAMLAIGALVTSAGAQVYHWVDDQEVVHYTTGIESVPERYRAAARALAVSSVEPPPPGSPATARAGTTSISFVAGAPIFVAAQINGAGPVTLILDTGADRSMVAPAALARLGIGTPNTYGAEIRGVTGATRADVVWIESLDVGGVRAGPLAIVAHDAGLSQADGLLGRDFLSLFSVTIDTRASIVTLEPN